VNGQYLLPGVPSPKVLKALAGRITQTALGTLDLFLELEFDFTKVDFRKLVIFQGEQIEQYSDRRPHFLPL
jgi:hypothetical protein